MHIIKFNCKYTATYRVYYESVYVLTLLQAFSH